MTLDPYNSLPTPKPEARRWSLVHHARPFTANEARRWTHWTLRKEVQEWRSTFFLLAKEAKVPRLERIRVEVNHWYGRGVAPDVGACAPAVKASIDGCVDAHVIPDDDPTHLLAIEYRAPMRMPDAWRLPGVTGALGLTIVEEEA